MRALFEMSVPAQYEPDLLRPTNLLEMQPALESTFEVLGQQQPTYSRVEDVVVKTQPWAEGDYSRPGFDFDLSDQQKERLAPVFDRLRMTRAWPLVGEDIDHILVLGSIQSGNDVRLGFLKQSMFEGGIAPETITLAGGQRYMFPETEQAGLAATIDRVRDTQAKPVDWLENLAVRDPAEIEETDLLRASALDQLGHHTLRAIHLHVGLGARNETPVHRYELDWGGVSLSLLHTRAVARKGESRHTTEACLDDWLKSIEPKPGSKLAIIGNQPHLQRLSYTAERFFAESGRSDLKVMLAGPAAPADYDAESYLKEMAQTVYEIAQRPKLQGKLTPALAII